MNAKSLVKLSNVVGIVSIILLIYWVFVFMSVEVFGLKVFRENITETFYMSILGILALMFGALIVNIMFNLTRIAHKHNKDDVNINKASKKLTLLFVLSFPLIFGLLYTGDYLTSNKKEKMLIASAKSIIEDNVEKANKLVDYKFDDAWINETRDILNIFSKTDKHFPNIHVITLDSIDNSEVFLHFNAYRGYHRDTVTNYKVKFILETTKEERDYLNTIFKSDSEEIRFSAHDGNYELFYPYYNGDKRIVLFFSDYQRYGKIGS